MNSALLVIFAIVFYALFGLCTSKAGGRIAPVASSVIFNGLGALVCLAALLVGRFGGQAHAQLTRSGLVYSVLAGLAIAVFSVLLIRIYARGDTLAVVFPTVYGGAIALTAAIGWLTTKDSFSIGRACGVALIVVGIGLVALV